MHVKTGISFVIRVACIYINSEVGNHVIMGRANSIGILSDYEKIQCDISIVYFC